MHNHTRPGLRHLVRLGVGAVAASGAVAGLAALPAAAAPGAVSTMDLTGLPVVCGATTYTVTSGTARVVDQVTQDANGVFHFTGTIAFRQVTASDGVSDIYSIVGSSWYGGSGTSPQTATVIDTEEFNVLGPGGKVADIHAALTFYPDGTVRGISLGTCALPQ